MLAAPTASPMPGDGIENHIMSDEASTSTNGHHDNGRHDNTRVPAVSVTGVYKSYGSGRTRVPVLKDLDMTVTTGAM